MTRVLVIAHVKPGPAVKAAFFDLSGVIEGRVVAQTIALVDHAPGRALAGRKREAAGITQTRRINRAIAAHRVERQNIGAARLGVPGRSHRLGLFPRLPTDLRLPIHIERHVGAATDR